jgi:hypothetical protein
MDVAVELDAPKVTDAIMRQLDASARKGG